MKLNEILGTEFPIIQGGMANIATGEFAAAVSNAGALGLIGAGGMDAETLRQHIRRFLHLAEAFFKKPFLRHLSIQKEPLPKLHQMGGNKCAYPVSRPA